MAGEEPWENDRDYDTADDDQQAAWEKEDDDYRTTHDPN